MTIPIPHDVRQLLDAPSYVHLSTLRADGSPRNWVVWVGLEDGHILVCTSDAIWKAKDMHRHPRVAISVTDMANPYHMATIQGRVVEVRPDEDCRYMDPISFKYTNKPFPGRGPDRVCFVIAVENAARRTLAFVHDPPRRDTGSGADLMSLPARQERVLGRIEHSLHAGDPRLRSMFATFTKLTRGRRRRISRRRLADHRHPRRAQGRHPHGSRPVAA